jgi:hypothetical protein
MSPNGVKNSVSDFEPTFNPIQRGYLEGNVIYFSIAGQHLIYLNDFQTAIDLFEKRSSIYSDRSQTPMMEL